MKKTAVQTCPICGKPMKKSTFLKPACDHSIEEWKQWARGTDAGPVRIVEFHDIEE